MSKRASPRTEPPRGAEESDCSADRRLVSSLDDGAFLEMIAARMSPEQRHASRALSLVKSVYVECGRDRRLAGALNDFLTSTLSIADGRRDSGRVLFVTGESGAGKSRAVERMLENNPLLKPYETDFGAIRPMISVSLDGPCTLKVLGRKILKAAGYPLRQEIEQGRLWEMLPEQLRQRRVLLVWIDETQHMLRHTKTDRERINVAKAVKGVMNNAAWPVSFVMSGMPETTELARLDEQIERRQSALYLSDILLPEERPLILRIIRQLCGPVNLDCTALVESDMPERIAHSARDRFGRVTQVVTAAIHEALKDDSAELHREHFALAYLAHSHARGHDEMNPFLVDRWQDLPKGLFLAKTSDRA